MVEDHPRIRGEHTMTFDGLEYGKGSSPHTRGARTTSRRRARRTGIIPAYAGSTLIVCSGFACSGDHPRIRGEHVERVEDNCDARGSSPHARGAQRNNTISPGCARIIPACAGSTQSGDKAKGTFRDHPRMRGEHSISSAIRLQFAGSSPHARGALLDHDARHLGPGIIPACAGSTREPLLLLL